MSDSLLPRLWQLPQTVWMRIAFFLSDNLPTLLLFSSLSPDLQYVFRPYTSSCFESIAPRGSLLSGDWYYHTLVRLVLEGHIDPSFIFEFFYKDQNRTRPKFEPSPTTRPGLSSDATEQQVCTFDRLFRDAVRASRFIPADLESEVCTRFQHGDQDAALLVLLPLCTRLKVLEIPSKSPMCAALFQRIGWEYQRRGESAETARYRAFTAALRDRSGRPRREASSEDALPFSELLILYVGTPDPYDFDRVSFPLTELTPFMGIPSLHRIVLKAVRDQSFPDWPTGDAKCSCPEIYFEVSSVSRQAVVAFATGLAAPCEIRQWYEGYNGFRVQEMIWDQVLVESRPDGTKEVTTRIAFEGGDPSCEHPWGSWLFHMRMVDWTRLDEEFSQDDIDVDIEWLQGRQIWA